MYEKCFNCSPNETKSSKWILDSGASLHMSYEKHNFQNLIMKPGGKIRIANGSFLQIMGFGTIKVLIKTQSAPIMI